MAKIKQHNKIRIFVQGVLKEQWWQEITWRNDVAGPDPFSPGALGNAIGGEMIPEGGYWKNGGDEPLFPEPFSNDALGWDFMPEHDEDSQKSMDKKDDKIGKEFWFEYHCLESPVSSDAEAWYHSHQKVIVLSRADDDNDEFPDEPKIYTVRFNDGIEWDVFDDELMNSPQEFYRPDPPAKPTHEIS